jgi:apolipoprotein N-acyltransferase
MILLSAASRVLNRHLAHLTALVGIPLTGLAVVLLAAIDLKIVRDRRPRLLLVLSALALTVTALGYMFYRFAALKT